MQCSFETDLTINFIPIRLRAMTTISSRTSIQISLRTLRTSSGRSARATRIKVSYLSTRLLLNRSRFPWKTELKAPYLISLRKRFSSGSNSTTCVSLRDVTMAYNIYLIFNPTLATARFLLSKEFTSLKPSNNQPLSDSVGSGPLTPLPNRTKTASATTE